MNMAVFEPGRDNKMSLKQTAKFWMVVVASDNPFFPPPKVRHSERSMAYREAERLARKEGVNFIVLEALDEVIVHPPAPRPPQLEWRRCRYSDPSDPDQVQTAGLPSESVDAPF